jgi:hypothetical protein
LGKTLDAKLSTHAVTSVNTSDICTTLISLENLTKIALGKSNPVFIGYFRNHRMISIAEIPNNSPSSPALASTFTTTSAQRTMVLDSKIAI